MDPKKKRRPAKGLAMNDAVLVRFTAELLPHDSPEFQERAKLPRSARGPNLALYHELQKQEGEKPPTTSN